MLCSGISITSRFKDSLRNTLSNGQEIYEFSSYSPKKKTRKKGRNKKAINFPPPAKKKEGKKCGKVFELGGVRRREGWDGEREMRVINVS